MNNPAMVAPIAPRPITVTSFMRFLEWLKASIVGRPLAIGQVPTKMSGTYLFVSMEARSMAKKPHVCGIGPAFEVIGGKWKAVILWELHAQARRPGELKRLIPGISEKMLIQQLREMEEGGTART